MRPECVFEDLALLKGSPDADAVVVVDVLRAFSTAAVALDCGAGVIFPVLGVEEAFSRRDADPFLVLMGESDCHPIPGFDLGNSPVRAAEFEFGGRGVVQRTTAGTRGLVTCREAKALWGASFLVGSATVAAIRNGGFRKVAFVITGTVHYGSADEDLACAEWMGSQFAGAVAPAGAFLDRVRGSVAASTFLDPASSLYAPADVEACARADVYGFCLRVRVEGGNLAIRREPAAVAEGGARARWA